MTTKDRAILEMLADDLEVIARANPDHNKRPDGKDVDSLMSLAWDIKQIARYGIPSFGV